MPLVRRAAELRRGIRGLEQGWGWGQSQGVASVDPGASGGQEANCTRTILLIFKKRFSMQFREPV